MTSHDKRYLMSILENYYIFVLSERISNDTKLSRIGLLERDGAHFLLFSLYFTSYFAQYLMINLTSIM